MSTRLLPQHHCRQTTDHSAHTVWPSGPALTPHYRCPGRYTPSNYRAPRPSPSVPSDPFFGIDDNEEY